MLNDVQDINVSHGDITNRYKMTEAAETKQRKGRDLDSLEYPIPGIPGEDYPIYSTALDTGFSCDGQVQFLYLLYKKSFILNKCLSFS